MIQGTVSPAPHQEKTDAHQKRDNGDDLALGAGGHALPFRKGFQMLVIELRAKEPSVQLFRAFSKGKQRQHQNGTVGNTGSTVPTAPRTRPRKPMASQNIFFAFILLLFQSSLFPLLIDHIPHGHNKMGEDHARPGKAHHGPDFLPHLRLVAVDTAI